MKKKTILFYDYQYKSINHHIATMAKAVERTLICPMSDTEIIIKEKISTIYCEQLVVYYSRSHCWVSASQFSPLTLNESHDKLSAVGV